MSNARRIRKYSGPLRLRSALSFRGKSGEFCSFGSNADAALGGTLRIVAAAKNGVSILSTSKRRKFFDIDIVRITNDNSKDSSGMRFTRVQFQKRTHRNGNAKIRVEILDLLVTFCSIRFGEPRRQRAHFFYRSSFDTKEIVKIMSISISISRFDISATNAAYAGSTSQRTDRILHEKSFSIFIFP